MSGYSDIQIIGQFEMLKKSCDVRGFSVAIEEAFSDRSEHIVIRRKSDNSVAHMSGSFIHSQGFLDGLDYSETVAK